MDSKYIVAAIVVAFLAYVLWSCREEKFTTTFPHTTMGGCAAAVNASGVLPLIDFYNQSMNFPNSASEPLGGTHNGTCDCLEYWAESMYQYDQTAGLGGFGSYWPTQCSPAPYGY